MDMDSDKKKMFTYQDNNQEDSSSIAENKIQLNRNVLRDKLLEESVRDNKELLERLSRT